uniref:Uncharacterized protein n=1 Tax=Glossina austeni TaxID=7395 RepID=A0A1A9UWU4_GLOAU
MSVHSRYILHGSFIRWLPRKTLCYLGQHDINKTAENGSLAAEEELVVEEVDYNIHVQEFEEGLEEVVAQDGSAQVRSSEALKQNQLLNPGAASQIFGFSAACYGFMRRNLGLNLPAPLILKQNRIIKDTVDHSQDAESSGNT